MEYVADPLSRAQLRDFALAWREYIGLTDTLYFPVVPFLEQAMPRLFAGFHYEIVPIEDFPPKKHAETDVINRIIRIREDVYYGALDRSSRCHGRDRMTIMHEIAHYLLMVEAGIKFNRVIGSVEMPKYRDPEWQADALAGEFLCPHHLICDLSVGEIIRACGVSRKAANFNLLID